VNESGFSRETELIGKIHNYNDNPVVSHNDGDKKPSNQPFAIWRLREAGGVQSFERCKDSGIDYSLSLKG
jgi:hypothetical protein